MKLSKAPASIVVTLSGITNSTGSSAVPSTTPLKAPFLIVVTEEGRTIFLIFLYMFPLNVSLQISVTPYDIEIVLEELLATVLLVILNSLGNGSGESPVNHPHIALNTALKVV